MIEKEIEKLFRRRIRETDRRILCLKFECPGFTGVPDRIILLPGASVVFVELKRPGKTERKRQLFVQSLLRRLGFEVYSAVSTREQIEEIFARCKEVIGDKKL